MEAPDRLGEDINNNNFSNKKVILIIFISLSILCLLILTLSLLSSSARLNNSSESCTIENSSINSGLILYFHFNMETSCGENINYIHDFSGKGNNGIASDLTWSSRGGEWEDGAFDFSGSGDKIRVADSDLLSPNTTGQFTVSYWVRFDNLSFLGEGSYKDYINFLGKGSKIEGYEYAFRQYNSSNTEERDNRLSFYVFNPEGGLGAGSYFQEEIVPGEWIYITGIIDGKQIRIYKNGVLRDSSLLSKYDIHMENTGAEFYIGDFEGNNNFSGSIDELRVYNKNLTDSQVKELYDYENKKR